MSFWRPIKLSLAELPLALCQKSAIIGAAVDGLEHTLQVTQNNFSDLLLCVGVYSTETLAYRKYTSICFC